MATITMTVDDLDGTSSAAELVGFGLDGETYEIDLTESNADRLRSVLAEFVGAARKTTPKPRAGSKPGGASGPSETAEIRAWAQSQGLDVSDRGRIPQVVVDAYSARTVGTPASPDEEPEETEGNDPVEADETAADDSSTARNPTDDEILAWWTGVKRRPRRKVTAPMRAEYLAEVPVM